MEKNNSLSLILDTKSSNPVLWENIQQINFELIKDRMIFKHHWSEEMTNLSIKEYMVFLYLTQVCEQPISPSKEVDEIWHEHILHTNKYENDCYKTFGKFIHHFPTPAKWKLELKSIEDSTESFCCDNKDCCNDDPRTTKINFLMETKSSCVPIGGDSTGANCSGTTNCGNGHPSDCSRLKPESRPVTVRDLNTPNSRQLLVGQKGELVVSCDAICACPEKANSVACSKQAIIKSTSMINFDNPKKEQVSSNVFFKDIKHLYFN
jgi:hypothetical protein